MLFSRLNRTICAHAYATSLQPCGVLPVSNHYFIPVSSSSLPPLPPHRNMPRHTARGVAAGNVAFGLEKGRKVTAAGQAPKISRRKGVRFRNHNLQNFTENTNRIEFDLHFSAFRLSPPILAHTRLYLNPPCLGMVLTRMPLLLSVSCLLTFYAVSCPSQRQPDVATCNLAETIHAS